ncbi:MAG TPA: glycosyltransferase [Phycisphaerae bacterium]|nr:glycosyltransferase [Phycisphaerae bacterium]
MDWTALAQQIVVTVYTIALALVCLYGFHRYALVYLYYRHRRQAPHPPGRFEDLPRVTIQLPMYNERFVARRIIEQTCRIDWPLDRLQIQVLDDSMDQTTEIASAAVARAAAGGFDIEYIHRDNRTGFKAGALENGLRTATGEFVTIFDADFIPPPPFLRECIDHFTDPAVCAVQTRWEHLNRDDSLLTRSQAIYLDGHFAIEHVARNRSGRFMAFNGTAGTWRKAAIADAGGWHHDTLTEDMDLSYRAQIRGWKFVFLSEQTTPAELPPEMSAFKAQQFRWTKGGAQTAIKMLPRILLSKVPLKAKVESFFHLTCFCVHACVVVLASLLMPLLLIRHAQGGEYATWRMAADMAVFSLGTISASVFYVASQYELFGDWRTVLKYLPFLMALGVGVSLSNTKALLEALFGKPSEFVRTPKYGQGRNRGDCDPARRRKRDLLPWLEMLFGLYMAGSAAYCVVQPAMLMAAPFLLIFAVGFFYVSILSFRSRAARAAKPAPETTR